jgi:Outer membrane protein and related peptidoglycan-associated (lipo)proteins
MKTAFIFSTLLVATVASANSHARTPNQQAALEGTTFAGLTIAGTVAAGPIGFLVGALGGAFLADQSRQANNAEIALQEADQKQEQLQHALQQKEADVNRLEDLATQRMTFQVLFASGADTLNELDKQRIKALADHLHANPELVVKLDGHADPRGTDEYNNVLSQERAKAVKDALEELGIAAERISYTGHGNRYSSAPKGDEEAYQQERRVDITIDSHAPAYSGI